jgi:hypothetical protein
LTGVMQSITPITPQHRFASRVFFGASTRIDSLLKVAKHCAYCGDQFTQTPQNGGGPVLATFDHLRLKSGAKGPTNTQNGVLACKPCNNARRGNVPLLEFLQGEKGPYVFLNGGDVVLKGDIATSFLLEWAGIRSQLVMARKGSQVIDNTQIKVQVATSPLLNSVDTAEMILAQDEPQSLIILTGSGITSNGSISTTLSNGTSPSSSNGSVASLPPLTQTPERFALEQKYIDLLERRQQGLSIPLPVAIYPAAPPTTEDLAEKAQEVSRRMMSFSTYLKRFTAQQYRLNAYQKQTWLAQSFDNILYPIWKEGVRPTDPQQRDIIYAQRVKLLFKVLAQADPQFWLGDDFKRIAHEDFPLDTTKSPNAPENFRRQAILGALNEVSLSTPATPLGVNNPFAQPSTPLLPPPTDVAKS